MVPVPHHLHPPFWTGVPVMLCCLGINLAELSLLNQPVWPFFWSSAHPGRALVHREPHRPRDHGGTSLPSTETEQSASMEDLGYQIRNVKKRMDSCSVFIKSL